MAIDNIKDFSVQWVLFGVLFLSLLGFATSFIYQNSPGALGVEGDKLGVYQTNITGQLVVVESDMDDTLEILAQNDPEVSDQGSKDSVASSFSIRGTANTMISSFKLFMSWIFAGTIGQLLVSVLVGMFGLLSVYFIFKYIRNGI